MELNGITAPVFGGTRKSPPPLPPWYPSTVLMSINMNKHDDAFHHQQQTQKKKKQMAKMYKCYHVWFKFQTFTSIYCCFTVV